jgi:hypothetical protein
MDPEFQNYLINALRAHNIGGPIPGSTVEIGPMTARYANLKSNRPVTLEQEAAYQKSLEDQLRLQRGGR